MCIPHIGTFELVQEAPRLDVADKVLRPPFYKTAFSEKDHVPEHQLQFFSSIGNHLKKELVSFGQRLRTRVQDAPVVLQGFGKLRYSSHSIVFEPEIIELAALQPVPAQKVIRENVQHNVLVGDREMSSQQVSDFLGQTFRKKPLFMIIGWSLLLLALTAIFFILYKDGFRIGSSGLRKHP